MHGSRYICGVIDVVQKDEGAFLRNASLRQSPFGFLKSDLFDVVI